MPDELAAFEKRFEARCNSIIDRLDSVGNRMDDMIDRMDNLVNRMEVSSRESIHPRPHPQFRIYEPPGLTWSQG